MRIEVIWEDTYIDTLDVQGEEYRRDYDRLNLKTPKSRPISRGSLLFHTIPISPTSSLPLRLQLAIPRNGFLPFLLHDGFLCHR